MSNTVNIGYNVGLYFKSVKAQLRAIENSIGKVDCDKFWHAYQYVLDTIDYDEMTYREEQELQSIIDRITRIAEFRYEGIVKYDI